MSGLGYRLLGFVVWKGGTWYLRRRYGAVPKAIAVGALTAGAVGLAVRRQRRAGAA